ncbi:MAG: hypothetical protein P8173_17010, partial [Gammaproteobacteria bacterium]
IPGSIFEYTQSQGQGGDSGSPGNVVTSYDNVAPASASADNLHYFLNYDENGFIEVDGFSFDVSSDGTATPDVKVLSTSSSWSAYFAGQVAAGHTAHSLDIEVYKDDPNGLIPVADYAFTNVLTTAYENISPSDDQITFSYQSYGYADSESNIVSQTGDQQDLIFDLIV